MRTSDILVVTILLLTVSLNSLGQNQYLVSNRTYIDSILNQLSRDCDSLSVPYKITKRDRKLDKERILFLNTFYNEELTVDQIRERIEPFFRRRVNFNISRIGEWVKYKTALPSEGSLKVNIAFTTFKGSIVFKYFTISSRKPLNCINPVTYGILDIDVHYLKNTFLTIAQFPFAISGGPGSLRGQLSFPDIYDSKRDSVIGSYKFPTTPETNYMTWSTVDRYWPGSIIVEIGNLTRQRDIESLEDYLFSPNHIVAIYAYEALTYLSVAKNASLSENCKKKMEEIRQSDIRFDYQLYDVLRRQTTYKELAITTSSILYLYNRKL